MKTLTLPKYIVLEQVQNTPIETNCHHCGRHIIHTNLVRNTETNEEFHLGNTCTKNFTGKTIKEIINETSEYEKEVAIAIRDEALNERKRTQVKSFKEVNPEMMEYINNNLNNSFIKDMKKRIEETGTLTNNMYSVILTMMLPQAELPQKFKDLEFKPLRISKKEGQYGFTFTLFGEANGELIRVFFSSINEKNDKLLTDKGIFEKDGHFIDNFYERDIKLKVSGSFDGYKIKRAKLSETA